MTRGTQFRLLIVTLLASDDPAMTATLGEHLKLLGVPKENVAMICGGGPADSPWVGRVHVESAQPLWRWALAVNLATSRLLKEHNPHAVYFRDDLTAAIAFPATCGSRLPRLLDKRGTAAGEARLLDKSARKQWLITKMERFNIRRAARVMAVSRTLAEQVGPYSRYPVAVVPNGLASTAALIEARQAARPSPAAVAYIGGGDRWQCIDETLNLLEKLQDRGIRTSVFTRDPDLSAKAAKRGLQARALARDELPATMRKLTSVLVLRRDHATTRAASPIKLGEAVAYGCTVVGTPWSWEGMHDLERASAAVIVDADAPDIDAVVEHVRTVQQEDVKQRRSRAEAAADLLDLTAHEGALARFYLGSSE